MKETPKFKELRKVFPFDKIDFLALRGHHTLFAYFGHAKLTKLTTF